MSRLNLTLHKSLDKINNQSKEFSNKIDVKLPQQNRMKQSFKLNDPLMKVRTRKFQKIYMKPHSINRNDSIEQNETQIKTKKQIIQQINQMQKNFIALRKFDFKTSRIKNKFKIQANHSINNLQTNNTYFQRKNPQTKYRSLQLPALKTKPKETQSLNLKLQFDQIDQSNKQIKILLSEKIRKKILNDINNHNTANIKEDIQLTRQADQAVWIQKFSQIKKLIKKNNVKKQEKYKNQLSSRFMNPYSMYLALNKIQKKLVRESFKNHTVVQQAQEIV